MHYIGKLPTALGFDSVGVQSEGSYLPDVSYSVFNFVDENSGKNMTIEDVANVATVTIKRLETNGKTFFMSSSY